MGADQGGPDLEQLYLDALKHPLRRRILRLAIDSGKNAISPARASRALGESLPSVSYHVRVLADHCLLKPVGTKRVRGAVEHFYRVDKAALEHPLVKAWTSRAG